MSETILLPRVASARVPGGLSLSGLCSLLAILAVVVVVSVPRLHGLALQENEADAKITARLLAQALGTLDPARVPQLRDVLRRPELAGLRADAELIARGRLLRRHGYLFEITRLPPSVSLAVAPPGLFVGPAGGLHSLRVIRAWPWAHGATGTTEFLVTEGGAILAHTGPELRWEGLEAAGQAPQVLAGWSRAR